MPQAKFVLDTNVALDWLVFADARFAPLAAMIAEGEIEILTSEDCRAEFVRVLAYPNFRLEALRQREHVDAYARATRLVAVPGVPRRLPQCRDPDDQKFLELADAAGADWLLTRDLALLELARRAAVRFRIARPEEALAALARRGQNTGV